MIERIDGSGQGHEHFSGISPRYQDLNWTGLNFTAEQFDTVTRMDKSDWQQEMVLHTELFTQLAHHLPQALKDTKAAIEKRMAA
jgi:phosphoenolpyruvate carboxykinase (GTP)